MTNKTDKAKSRHKPMGQELGDIFNKTGITPPGRKNLEQESEITDEAGLLKQQLTTLQTRHDQLEQALSQANETHAKWRKKALAVLINTAVSLYEADLDSHAADILKQVLVLDPDNTLARENLAILEPGTEI